MLLPDILSAAEWGGTCTKQTWNQTLSCLLGGQSLWNLGYQLVTTTTSFLYSNETFQIPGFLYSDNVMTWQNVGCRPRTNTALWTSGGAGTAYINRFTDGEVWVSSSTNSRTGTKISNSIASAVYPRGIKYLIVQLIGGGGAGGTGGLGATYSNHGGQGAAGVVCIQLPDNGYATLVVGSGGTCDSGIAKDGRGGTNSSISSNGFTATAGAGGGGDGSVAKNKGSGGSWSTSGSGGVVIASSGGTSGDSGARYITYNDYCPEGGSKQSPYAGAGGYRGGSGYGAGGTGGTGLVNIFY